MNRTDLAQAYFQAYLFWLGPSLGAVFFLALHRVTGGRWGRDLALSLRGTARTVPLMAVLFVPIIFIAKDIFPWLRGSAAGVPFHPDYLSLKWFLVRAAVYFLVWLVLSWKLRGPVAKHGEALHRGLPSAAMILIFLTVSSAAIDWSMSLTEHWFSSVYGLIVLTSAGLTTMALAVMGPISPSTDHQPQPPRALGDTATLLLVTLMAAAYAQFSQLIIMWSGNEPDEMVWYNARYTHGWEVLSWVIVFGGFALPFFLLLFKRLKRDRRRLTGIASVILIGQALTNYWLVVPSLDRGVMPFRWVDAALLVAVGGIWTWFYQRSVRQVRGEVYA